MCTIDDDDFADLAALMRRNADPSDGLCRRNAVYLARRERLTTVFTIDHDDFETYRIVERQRFRVVPER